MAVSTIDPPAKVASAGVSPSTSHTQSGVKGTSSAAMSVASAAGTRREPIA